MRRSFRWVVYGGAFGLLWSCALELKGPPGPPRFSPEGIWFSLPTAERPGTVIAIDRRLSKGQETLRFREVVLVQRDLLISGKVLFLTYRKGMVTTSSEELLFFQEEYRTTRHRNKSKDPSLVWPADGYGAEELDREIRRGSGLRLLRFADGGKTLRDDALTLTRLSNEGTRVPAGVVLLVDWAHARALVVCPREPAPDGLAALPGGKSAKLLGRHAERFTIALEDGITVGRPMFGTGGVPVPKTALTREEILGRLRRGESVSREDLIRVLGPDAAKKRAP